MSSKHVAFLGLGTMGEGMVANLVSAGMDVRVWNRTAQKASALAAKLDATPGGGAIAVAESPRSAVEGAEFVLSCVASDEALEAVAFGDDGAMAALREDGAGEGVLWADHGTTSLQLSARLDEATREAGARFVDAPITGSMLGAQGGKLTFMVGGADDDVARLRPLMDVMGKHVVHVGDSVGDGQKAKFCLNMTQAVVLEGVLEGYALAVRSGVPLAKLAEIFEHSAGKTGVGSFKTPYLERGDLTAHFKLALMHKDLRLALDMARSGALELPLADRVRRVYADAEAAGWGDLDFLATAKLLEQRGGVTLLGDGSEA